MSVLLALETPRNDLVEYTNTRVHEYTSTYADIFQYKRNRRLYWGKAWEIHNIRELTYTQGKAKQKKWQEFVDAGISQKDAEDKYVKLGEELLAKYDN